MRALAPVVLVAGMAMQFGCGANTYSTAEPGSNVDLQRRVIRNPGLESDIRITSAIVTRAAGNAVGQVTLVNSSSSERRIQVRWSWLDKDGGGLGGSEQPWQSYTLAGGEIREIKSAGGQDGQDFRITIRRTP